jgi:hypothetical protein
MTGPFDLIRRPFTWPRDNRVPTPSIFTKAEESPMGIPSGLRSRMSFIEFHPSSGFLRWPNHNADEHLKEAKKMLDAAVEQDRIHQPATEGAARRLAVAKAPSEIVCQLYSGRIIAVAAISLEQATKPPKRSSEPVERTSPLSERE